MEVAAQIIAPARLDLPLIEYSWEFCRIAKAIAFDDATILSLFWHGANLHRLVGPPDTTGPKMEGGDPPVSGEFPALSQSQPAIVRSSHMPATVRGSFTPTVRSPRKPAAVRGSSSHTAVRGQSRPAGSEYGKTACSEFGKPAGHSSFQASASASTGLSRARSSSAPSRACSSTAPPDPAPRQRPPVPALDCA